MLNKLWKMWVLQLETAMWMLILLQDFPMQMLGCVFKTWFNRVLHGNVGIVLDHWKIRDPSVVTFVKLGTHEVCRFEKGTKDQILVL